MLKFSDNVKLKKLGNEDQIKLNAQVQYNLEEASQDNVPVKCLKLIKEGNNLIKVRQKHILLADQSPSSWTVVQQYKQHDPSDGKNILQAETRAKAKVAQEEDVEQELQLCQACGSSPLVHPELCSSPTPSSADQASWTLLWVWQVWTFQIFVSLHPSEDCQADQRTLHRNCVC